MSAFNAGRGDKPDDTLAFIVRRRMEFRPPNSEIPQNTLFGIPIIYQEVMGMPDMPKDNIPDNVLKKVAGTSKCAEDPPQDDCCEEEDDD
jgi:hypothetical protein